MKKYIFNIKYSISILSVVCLLSIYGTVKNSQNSGIKFLNSVNSSVTGFIEGKLKISAAGDSNYEIDIIAPPGIKGVHPKLKITYNNSNSNGILGVGWHLSGLSVISRSGKTIQNDGIKSGITFTGEDRFKIDGQRLIAYKNNNTLLNTKALRNQYYGKIGTEYRTEIESWSRIISKGNCGGSPCSFIVHSKDGSVAEYSNSNALASGAKPHWTVTKMTDRNGNYVSITYQNNSNQLVILPKIIEYTGNTNLTPQRKISFSYETRKDTVSSYIAGYKHNNNQRLQLIKTFVKENLVKSYQINYKYAKETDRSLITSVSVCDGQNNCITPTLFTWSDDEQDALFQTNQIQLPQNFKRLKYRQLTSTVKGDFNGDGKLDIILLNPRWNDIYYMLSNPSPNNPYTSGKQALRGDIINFVHNKNKQLIAADQNGDGKSAVFFFIPNKELAYLYFDGTEFKSKIVPMPAAVKSLFNRNNSQVLSGDFNGDGLPDFINIQKNDWTIGVLSTNSNNTFSGTSSRISQHNFSKPAASYKTGDFNGDGLTDILALVPNSWDAPLLISNGQFGFSSFNTRIPYVYSPNDSKFLQGDFNGDGITDIGVFKQNHHVIDLLFFNGKKDFIKEEVSFNSSYVNTVNSRNSFRFLGDINGDKITDIVAMTKNENNAVCFTSSGQKKLKVQSYPLTADIRNRIAGSAVPAFVSDYNGDGLIDISALNLSYPTLPILFAKKESNENNRADLLLSIKNGIGKITNLTYKPITDSVVYANSNKPVTYPFLRKQNPQYVVATLEKTGGQEGSETTKKWSYKYVDAITNYYRGFAGFQHKITTDYQKQITLDEQFFLKYYNNVPKDISKVRKLSDGKLVGISTKEFGFKSISNTGMYQQWNIMHRKEHYTNGMHNYTTKKEYSYDQDYRNIILIHDYGDTAVVSDDIFHHAGFSAYNPSLDTFWYAYYPIAEKSTKTNSINWTTWEENNDLTWSQIYYDNKRNITLHKSYMDNNGAGSTGSWIQQKHSYDDFGNLTKTCLLTGSATICEESQTSQINYDSEYHTFPVKITSPQNVDGKSLTHRFTHDPRFGLLITKIDPNGNTVFNIPNGGIDGFGRVLQTESVDLRDSTQLVTTSRTEYAQPVPSKGYQVLHYVPTNWTAASQTTPDSTWLFSKAFMDSYGREYKSQTNGRFAGQYRTSLVNYNTKGQLHSHSFPFFESSGVESASNSSQFIKYSYDSFGRPKSLKSPNPNQPSDSVIVEAIIRNPQNDDISYKQEISPANDQNHVYYKQVLNAKRQLISYSGPYTSVLPDTPGKNFGTTTYKYNAIGELIEKQGPGNKDISTYKYNSLGHLTQETNPTEGTTKYVYNEKGLLVQRIHSGKTISFTYDNLHRPVTKTIGKGSDKQTYHYEYDKPSIASNSMGRLAKSYQTQTRNANPVYNYTFHYDSRGNLKAKTVNLNGLSRSYTQAFVYDAANRMIKSIYPDNSSVDMAYNHGGHLASVSLGGNSIAAYSDYDAMGNYQKLQYQNGVSTNLSHDLWGRMTSSNSFKGSFNMYQADYDWTTANKLKTVTDKRAKYEHPLHQSFEYSAAGRLLHAKGPYGTETFKYNPSGDRIQFSDGTNTFNYNYDNVGKHQLQSITLNGNNQLNYAYDDAGNLTQKKIHNSGLQFSYDFDGAGRLVSVSESGTNLGKFTYGASGHRIVKNIRDTVTYYVSPTLDITEFPGGKKLYTKYVHGPGGVIYSSTSNSMEVSKPNEILESVAAINSSKDKDRMGFFFFGFILNSGITSALILGLLFYLMFWIKKTYRNTPVFNNRPDWSLKRKFQWSLLMCVSLLMLIPPISYGQLNPGANGAGMPVNGTVKYYTHNQVGSTSLITNEHGGHEELTQIIYSPFGKIDRQVSKGTDDFRPKFTGKELDAALGLQYFGSRYYDAHIGRFISPDPARQYSSPYTYADSDPLSRTDPTGASAESIFAQILIGGATTALSSVTASHTYANANKSSKNSAAEWEGIAIAVIGAVATVLTDGAALPFVGAAEMSVEGAADIATADFLAEDAAATASETAFRESNITIAGNLIGKADSPAEMSSADAVSSEGAVSGSAEDDAVDSGETQTCPMSFPAGTEVWTEDGSVNIEDIQVGDEVLSWDEKTESVQKFAVTNLFRRTADELVILTVGDSETIAVTPEHPIYTSDKEWVEAQFLTDSSYVLALERSISESDLVPGKITFLPITTIEYTHRIKTMVYNLEVEVTHNYFVGESIFLVHNCNHTDDDDDDDCYNCKTLKKFKSEKGVFTVKKASSKEFNEEDKEALKFIQNGRLDGHPDKHVNLKEITVEQQLEMVKDGLGKFKLGSGHIVNMGFSTGVKVFVKAGDKSGIVLFQTAEPSTLIPGFTNTISDLRPGTPSTSRILITGVHTVY